jgi:hypothetical protein
VPDLGWSAWSTIVTIISIVLAVVPGLFRFRGVLSKWKDLIAEIIGIIVLLGGLLLYSVTVPQWVQIQSQMTQLSTSATPTLGQEVQSLHALFFGSIGLMMLGGLLTVFGLLGRMTTGAKRK